MKKYFLIVGSWPIDLLALKPSNNARATLSYLNFEPPCFSVESQTRLDWVSKYLLPENWVFPWWSRKIEKWITSLFQPIPVEFNPKCKFRVVPMPSLSILVAYVIEQQQRPQVENFRSRDLSKSATISGYSIQPNYYIKLNWYKVKTNFSKGVD